MTVKAKTRQTGEFFQPTIMFNEPFWLNTTTLDYQTDFPPFLIKVWNYITSVWVNSEIDVHYTVRLENVTADAPATGAWVQAKQNFDGQFSQGDIPTSQPIQDQLYAVIESILKSANYN